MPVLEISVVPVGTNETSFSSYVVEACKSIDNKSVKYQITPTATVIEGDLDQLMDIARQMHEAPFKMGAQRVITNLTLDERHDQLMNMEHQVQSINNRLR